MPSCVRWALLFVAGLLPGLAVAAGGAAGCASGKMKAVGIGGKALLQCHARAVARGDALDAACRDKQLGSLARLFAKLDVRGGCAATDDAPAVQARIDQLVADVVGALPDGGTDDGRGCAGMKIGGAAKHARGQLVCHAKGLAKGTPVDGACLLRSNVMLDVAFTKAERKGGCATTDDRLGVQALLETFASDVVGLLTPP